MFQNEIIEWLRKKGYKCTKCSHSNWKQLENNDPFNIMAVIRIVYPHTSYIPTSRLIFHSALVQLTPKGDFATVGHDAHAAHAHKQDQLSNELLHRDENQQSLAAFNFPDLRVSIVPNPLKTMAQIMNR